MFSNKAENILKLNQANESDEFILLVWKELSISLDYPCSAQTRTGIGLREKPPAVKQFLAVESHLGVRASYATRRKCRYEANKCGWTQPLFRKARDRRIN
jgi:hypothetical protein